MYNQNFQDNLNVASFYLGLLNYQENLTQTDKQDLVHSMQETNEALLAELRQDISEQNAMLREIIQRLDKLERKED
mgnify:CR=1 FL=1